MTKIRIWFKQPCWQKMAGHRPVYGEEIKDITYLDVFSYDFGNTTSFPYVHYKHDGKKCSDHYTRDSILRFEIESE